MRTSHRHEPQPEGPRFCAHCLASLAGRPPVCRTCGAEFSGAGTYDLVEGPQPSSIFFQIFGKPAVA